MKTEKIHLNNLRNDEHFQLNTEFSDAVNRFNAQTLKIKPQFDIYVPLFEQLGASGGQRVRTMKCENKVKQINKIIK